jgi:hypothetical protein
MSQIVIQKTLDYPRGLALEVPLCTKKLAQAGDPESWRNLEITTPVLRNKPKR